MLFVSKSKNKKAGHANNEAMYLLLRLVEITRRCIGIVGIDLSTKRQRERRERENRVPSMLIKCFTKAYAMLTNKLYSQKT